MGRAIGVLAVEHVAVGLIEDNRVAGALHLYPEKGRELAALREMPAETIAQCVCEQIEAVGKGLAVESIGIGFPGIIRDGLIEESRHCVVTLDPKEHFCGCGGRGHLEGIMGHRSMRLRFLDMEPEEVFENARAGDSRCVTFVRMWHRALAAATATSIHMDGPGKFFISGPNSKYIDMRLLNMYVQEMVKMSPLQGSLFELVSVSDEIGVIGAAVNAQSRTRLTNDD